MAGQQVSKVKWSRQHFGGRPRGNWRVYEVGISYSARTYAEGKKIGWRDGVRAIYCIVLYSPIGTVLPVRRMEPAVQWLTKSRA